jgi:TnpA family transposase
MKKENTTKAALLDGFDKSENKKNVEACRIAGVSVSGFFFHYYKDEIFRRQVLEKKLKHLSDRIANA